MIKFDGCTEIEASDWVKIYPKEWHTYFCVPSESVMKSIAAKSGVAYNDTMRVILMDGNAERIETVRDVCSRFVTEDGKTLQPEVLKKLEVIDSKTGESGIPWTAVKSSNWMNEADKAVLYACKMQGVEENLAMRGLNGNLIPISKPNNIKTHIWFILVRAQINGDAYVAEGYAILGLDEFARKYDLRQFPGLPVTEEMLKVSAPSNIYVNAASSAELKIDVDRINAALCDGHDYTWDMEAVDGVQKKVLSVAVGTVLVKFLFGAADGMTANNMTAKRILVREGTTQTEYNETSEIFNKCRNENGLLKMKDVLIVAKELSK